MVYLKCSNLLDMCHHKKCHDPTLTSASFEFISEFERPFFGMVKSTGIKSMASKSALIS
jgi:hypothetical protein